MDGSRPARRWWPLVAIAVMAAGALAGCERPGAVVPSTTSAPPATSTTTSVPPTTTTSPPATTTTTTSPPPTTSPPTTVPPAPHLSLGARGPAVRTLQLRLAALHYWVGAADGVFGDSTEQAVYALQKAAGIARDGVVGPQSTAAIARGVTPTPRASVGHQFQIDLARDLLLIVDDGHLAFTLNTSTGGGYVYGHGAVAVTPRGHFGVYRQVDGVDVSPLGVLWRPKYFYSGYAIHGSASVPPYPVSHGCVRVSDEAIDWIWANDLAPVGTSVWVYD
jgi:hypothetical protein